MAEDIKLYFNMESNDITFCNIIKYMSICIHIYVYIYYNYEYMYTTYTYLDDR